MRRYRHGETPGLDKLWVVVPISNPARYRSRYELFERFRASVLERGANLLVVEAALGDRQHEFATSQACDARGHRALPLRTWDELWHKECMVNLGVAQLPPDWEYVAWVDGDVGFHREDWLEETCHLLQHYQVAQLFSNAVDLGPTGQVLSVHNGLVWSWATGQPEPFRTDYYGGQLGAPNWHSGFAWAARREAFDALGGLYDVGILGSGDWIMAWALVDKLERRINQKYSAAFKETMLRWQDRARRHVRSDVGYMEGTIFHGWHGKKRDRKYLSREAILSELRYDPAQDLKRDWQGLWALSDQGERLRVPVRRYFHERNEDSVDL